MRKIILIALLFLIALSSDGFCRNFALIAGGTHEPKPDSTFSNNIFSNSMGSWSRTLKEKNWNVDVLFNGEHYFSDWTEFHVSTRPTDAASSSFTKDHLTERVNHLLEQNLTAEDQVELAISEHGSVREGQFGIAAENGRMEADNLTSYLEKLLETGAKVHLNLDSCYSGQFIKNAQALLNHPLYGSKLCITTLAAQDAEGQLNDSLLDKMSQI
ncbi:MAG: hypothetical protein HYW85_05285, partial [Deltaproteobacteria bacterium]|nr:hypothetical protein [Deltaproteobacteria bacterium]